MPVFDEKFWTLPQTLLWIMSSDLTKIDTIPAELKNHLTGTLNADTLDIYRSDKAQNTIQEIKAAAGNEKIRVYGIKHGQNTSPTVIPAIDWHTSILKGNNNNFRLEHEGNTVWSNLLFETQTVLKQWPSPNAIVIPRKRGRKKGDGAYDDSKMLSKMMKFRKSGKAKSKNDAATQIVDLHEKEIRGSSREAKIKRLQEKYSKFEKKYQAKTDP